MTLGGNRTVTVAASTLTVGGATGDAGHAYSLTKAGAGTLVLAGNNTYSGSTAINAGTLQIGNGSSGYLGLGGNYTAAITNNGTLLVNTPSPQTFGGAITGTGNLYQNGSGTTTLAGGATLNGNIYANAGVLNFNGGTYATGGFPSIVCAAYNNNSTATINFQSGTLNINNYYLGVGWQSGADGTFNQSGGTVYTTSNLNLGRFGGSGAYNMTGGSASFGGIEFNNGDTSGNGYTSGGSSSLTVGGNGVMTAGSLGPQSSASSTYTDTVTVQGSGVLTINGAVSLATTNNIAATLNLNGGTLQANSIAGDGGAWGAAHLDVQFQRRLAKGRRLVRHLHARVGICLR